jgi:hypothetical protein
MVDVMKNLKGLYMEFAWHHDLKFDMFKNQKFGVVKKLV